MAQPVIIALSSACVELAKSIGSPVISENVVDAMRQAFRLRQPIIAVGASGIVIRSLAPLLADKFSEPPVLCVSLQKSVIVLLGGHHGANALAEETATAIQGQAIISTAGGLGAYLESLPPCWKSQGDAKPLMVKSLRGEKINLYDPLGLSYIPENYTQNSDKESADIIISDKQSDEDMNKLMFYPPTIALGIGCERYADSKTVLQETEKLLQELDIAKPSIATIASIDIKADEPALQALQAYLQCDLRFFTAEELCEYDSQLLNPSDIVQAEVGCRGVAEGAALAVMQGAEFITGKRKYDIFTCAVSRAKPQALQGSKIGRLDIVGIGPGDSKQRTESCSKALLEAEVVVGYKLYLDLCDDIIYDKERLDYALGEEELRCLKALQLAAEGKKVALVCSGDAGIYALAAVVYDVLANQNNRKLNAVEIQAHPGISAFQMLMAKSGAPFGDDFCLISLSDLWVEADTIKRRIHAAIDGDFAIAFYNPQSKTRRSLLPYALEQLLQHRGSDTPVIIGKHLGRKDEEILCLTLGELEADSIDMLSLVMIGNSRTRYITLKGELRAYSPRILSRTKEAT